MKSVEFIATLNGDDSLLVDQLNGCQSLEQVYEIARNRGLEDTLEVFTAYMRQIANAIKKLNDEDLARVTGGVLQNGNLNAGQSPFQSQQQMDGYDNYIDALEHHQCIDVSALSLANQSQQAILNLLK